MEGAIQPTQSLRARFDSDDEERTLMSARAQELPPLEQQPVPPAAAVAAHPEQVREEVKNILYAVDNTDELNLSQDEDALIRLLLYRAGGVKYGIAATETYIWLKPRLVPVGWWIDPEIVMNGAADRELISQPEAAVANVDLVGALWSMSANTDLDARPKLRSTRKQHKLHWRDIRSIIDDPYQSHGARTEALYNAGCTQACGIPFNVYGICGLVVWYAKAGIDEKLLKDPVHELYLRRVSHMRGALLALFDARRNCVELMDEQSAEIQESGVSIGTAATLESPSMIAERIRSMFARENMRKAVIAWLKKIRGGGAQLPPCMSWGETLWTVIGSFVGFLCIAIFHKAGELVDEYT